MERVLIANRGEIASRLAKTLKKMGFFTVGLTTNWDINLPYTETIDVVYHCPVDDPREVFTNPELLISVAKRTGCRHLHPGYGFLSESSDFAKSCEESGIIFIGPSSDAIKSLGSKINLKKICNEYGIPHLQEFSLNKDLPENYFPIILKGSDTGGGRGMRIVQKKVDLENAIRTAENELKTFGSSSLFAEPYLKDVKHIEIQVIVTKSGKVNTLIERDCSVQRKFQKVIEETPSPGVDESLREKLLDTARTVASSLKYASIFTYEFLVSGKNFYLSEINTRLQVEHTITEALYDIDLVEIQTKIALGSDQVTEPTQKTAHAIQARVYAEDVQSFTPSSGYAPKIHFGVPPQRLEQTYRSGNFISPFYDSLIAKIIECGDRETSVRNLKNVLMNLSVSGVKSNRNLLLWVLNNHKFLSGQYSTNLLEYFIPLDETDFEETSVKQAQEHMGPEHKSPLLGTVSKIFASQSVQKGQMVMLLESMKIQHPICAGISGKLRIFVKEGDVVRPDQILFTVEPD
ncbi:MAG: ATP-grasp domain-containing protein [Deltaproteobacteria bacterium]|nr:ATP-grasp domain-containing protein [Deltaproteobacteria bacterium]